MTSNIDKIIRKTETIWLEPLMIACTQQFANTHLPSHNQTHHKRVWEYAKDLIIKTSQNGMIISENDIERLIIAVFIHDQGMSETSSKDHGKISRKMCKAFINKCNIPKPDFFEQVLDAIENHDNKEYLKPISIADEFNIQVFINTADDLDAFGTIGAYRYTEIYLLRQIAVKAIPEAVLTNMERRYKHFSENFAHFPQLVTAHYQRYITSRNFFKDLNFQIGRIEYSPQTLLGPIGVVNYIKNEILDKKRSPNEVCLDKTLSNTDFYCQHFFHRLHKEMREFDSL